MSKVPLIPLVNLANQTTAVNAINANSTTITTAFDNTVSRDGTQPNQMGSNLDMNNNRILNTAAPIASTDVVRFQDLSTFAAGGSITFNNLPTGGTAGQSLTKNSSTNFDAGWQNINPTNISFTQTGTGGVPLSLDTYYRNKIITPEMFGAVSSPVGTSAGSIVDSTAAIQAAINALAAMGGGLLQFGPGAYATKQINISTNNIYIKGVGFAATTIVHTMTGASTCFNFSAGASILSNIGISDLNIGSADTAFIKTGIQFSDCSNVFVNNIGVSFYPVDGTMYRGPGTSGTGIQINGRDTGHVNHITIYANNPIVIGTNPNNATISLDSWTFMDCNLVAPLSGIVTTSNITFNTGVVITDVTFGGRQNWQGGLHGLFWNDTTSVAISVGLYISGVKCEQPATTGGYAIYVSTNNVLYSLTIRDCLLGDRNGIFMNKVSTAKLEGVFYDATSNPTKIGLTITNPVMVDVSSCAWITGTTATFGGMTVKYSSGIPAGPFSAAIVPSGVYSI